MKTGNTGRRARRCPGRSDASMEPGHEDREYRLQARGPPPQQPASMEPGHEDREYVWTSTLTQPVLTVPQWSPVMKTGNTRHPPPLRASARGLNGARS